VVKVADFNQYSQFGSTRNKAQCDHCEILLADALDHTLSPADQAIFDLHLATCSDCTRMYMDARRGADWLMMLKTPQPEPADDLLERIFAATRQTGAAVSVPQTTVEPNTLLGHPELVTTPAPVVYAGNVIPFRQRVTNAFRIQSLRQSFMQPRLAMTAAMAFFSIALTLNLTGVRITQLRAADFKPSSLKRSFYDTNARVMRSVDNLRVVYELESRVQDLQRRDDDSTTSAPQSNSQSTNQTNQNKPADDQQQNDQKAPQQKQPAPRPRSGSSRSMTPSQSRQYTASAPQQNQNARPGSPQPGSFLQVSFQTPNVFGLKQGGQA
jgi:hypothetical protein